jgi:hypothetical protein
MANISLALRGSRVHLGIGSFCTVLVQAVQLSGNQSNSETWHFPIGWDGVKISPVLPITYRQTWLPSIPKFSSVKGTTLTNEEIDANFKVLQDEIVHWAETLEWARAIIANRYVQMKDVYEDYQVVMEDSYNTMIRVHADEPTVIWIPEESVVNFPIGSAILISWNGNNDGVVSVAPLGSTTIKSPDTLEIARRYGKITVIKTQPNYWEVEGNLAYDPV